MARHETQCRQGAAYSVTSDIWQRPRFNANVFCSTARRLDQLAHIEQGSARAPLLLEILQEQWPSLFALRLNLAQFMYRIQDAKTN